MVLILLLYLFSYFLQMMVAPVYTISKSVNPCPAELLNVTFPILALVPRYEIGHWGFCRLTHRFSSFSSSIFLGAFLKTRSSFFGSEGRGVKRSPS